MSLRATLRRLGRQARDFSLRHIHPRAPGVHYFLFFRLRRYLARLNNTLEQGKPLDIRGLLPAMRAAEADWQPLVSVIVPAYNHEQYLDQRLESIYSQSYRNFEVILLDDASADGSAAVLGAWAKRHPGITRLHVSAENSGSPFSQWGRGLDMARGELVWIAESDDFSDPAFLEHLVPLFANPAVNLAFGFTVFTDEAGEPGSWGMRDYLPELGPDFWDQPFTNSAHKLVSTMWSRRNLIPNVSGLLFRPAQQLSLLQDPQWSSLRICGDWWLYLALARGGMVAYHPDARNYYRQHPSNTSVSEHKSMRYIDEHLLLAEQVLSLYALDEAACQRLRQELWDRCGSHIDGELPAAVQQRIEAVRPQPPFAGRKPNVLMVTYALVAGGGEILPLRLANQLHRAGYAVTVLDCAQLPEQAGVRAMLDTGVPLVSLDDLRELPALVRDLGIEVIHSHNAWADSALCELLRQDCPVPHVITSHGMYDALDEDQLDRLGALLRPWLGGVAYVAEKNRGPLLRMGFDGEQLQPIPNAFDQQSVSAVPRAQLGVPAGALLLCIASRGIREKGWQEAVEAVAAAREASAADIHLLILGDGPERARLQQQGKPWLHLAGFRSDVREHFASADLGLLPSWFEGESHPLALLECLSVGRPVIATDIGDISAMLTTPEGVAGTLVPLREGRLAVADLTRAIVAYAGEDGLLARHAARCAAAAKVNNCDAFLLSHEELYSRALGHTP